MTFNERSSAFSTYPKVETGLLDAMNNLNVRKLLQLCIDGSNVNVKFL